MNNPLSKLEATKSVSLSKEATESQAGHSKKRILIEQATSGPTSLGVTGEVRANPQLSNSIAEADPGKSTPKDLLSQQQGNDKGTQNFSFDHIIAAMKLESLEDGQPFMVLSDEEEEFYAKPNAKTEDTSLKKEKVAAKVKTAFLFAQPSFPNVQQLTELLIIDINGVVGEIKKYVEELKVEILDALPSLLNKVTKALDRFAAAIESASKKAGLDVVERTYKDKVKYDKYYLKMLNKRSPGKITYCDVLSGGKSPITLKIYMNDGSDEIIQNFKASDFHLGEWREVMNAWPNRIRAGQTTIYFQIRQRLDALHKTEEELDFSKPLREQDSILKLNLLVKKKRKNADDLYDYFRSTKRYKTSIQFSNHEAVHVLNEPYLGSSLSEDSSASIILALRRSSSIFTSVYVAVQKLKKALARASIQLGWQCQAEQCRSSLKS
ncbi:hypothetical protein Tco_1254200 [Tanacetum coccineum]